MEIARRALEEGITPLEVMLEIMREAYEEGDKATAHAAAKDAAPYVHSKMATVEMKTEVETKPQEIIFRVVKNGD